VQLLCNVVKLTNLELKTRPRQLLDYLLLTVTCLKAVTCNFVTLLRYKLLANSDSTEVDHYNHNAQIVGSNPAAGTVRETLPI
jgi:hypothetical protein